MSQLKKPLTLTYFFLLLSLFVAYRVGAFDFKKRQQAQTQQGQTKQDTIRPKPRTTPYTMSSSKSMHAVPIEISEKGKDIPRTFRYTDSISARERLIMSSSKSAIVFPASTGSLIDYDSLFRILHRDTVKQKQ